MDCNVSQCTALSQVKASALLRSRYWRHQGQRYLHLLLVLDGVWWMHYKYQGYLWDNGSQLGLQLKGLKQRLTSDVLCKHQFQGTEREVADIIIFLLTARSVGSLCTVLGITVDVLNQDGLQRKKQKDMVRQELFDEFWAISDDSNFYFTLFIIFYSHADTRSFKLVR